jgi:hypothetical protein
METAANNEAKAKANKKWTIGREGNQPEEKEDWRRRPLSGISGIDQDIWEPRRKA